MSINKTTALICVLYVVIAFLLIKNMEYKHNNTNLNKIVSELKLANSITNRSLNALQYKYGLNIEISNTFMDWVNSKSRWYVPRQEVEYIVRKCMQHKNGLMIIAIMIEESNFDRYAKNKSGALSLGQIIPKYWENELISTGIWESSEDIFVPAKHIGAINYILTTLYTKFNSWPAVLNYYVGGDKAYVKRVLSNYNKLKTLYKE